MSASHCAVQDELISLAWLADLGELAGPVAHELSNFLNALLLHLTVLELTPPEAARLELAGLARQGRAAARVIQQWQQYRQRPPGAAEAADLNQAASAAVERLEREVGVAWHRSLQVVALEGDEPAAPSTRGRLTMRLDLAPDLPAAAAPAHELERLCLFLLRNALDAIGSDGGAILVRTNLTNGKILLCIEDTGQSVAPPILPQLFEPACTGRTGTRSLELAACKSIVRRRAGKIRAENQPDRGVVVFVELPTVPA